MPTRKITAVYFTDENGTLHSRGSEPNLSEADAKRLDSVMETLAPSSLRDYLDANGRQGGVNTAIGGGPGTAVGDGSGHPASRISTSESTAGLVPSEMTDEQIDGLSGKELEDAVEMAAIDSSQGGSVAGFDALADGGMSADEKRAALKAANR
jgi:hypothetical protein